MEYDLNGILSRGIRFKVPEIKWLIFQLLKAIEYLHANDVMHRDIKGANILLSSDGTLKLADFGLAKQYDRFRKFYTNKVVTLWYRAPELLLGSFVYNKAIDIWSAGWFLAELFLGRPLFVGDCESRQIDLIFKIWGTPTEETWPGVTSLPLFQELKPQMYINSIDKYLKTSKLYPEILDEYWVNLIRGMLFLNPNKRFTVADCFLHPFFHWAPFAWHKEDLPIIEGEAHEHAVREEIKRIKVENEKSKDQPGHGLQYPVTKEVKKTKRAYKKKNENTKGNLHSGKKRSYEDRLRDEQN